MLPSRNRIKDPEPAKLEDRHYIRQKLYGGKKSALQRYAELVVGRMSLWRLLKYELLTCLLGPMPGAIGLLLRKLLYPSLFRAIGRGVVFGQSVVIRNPDRIVLGDRVVIDDHSLLDGRGGGDGDEGVRIGDEVIVNRGVVIQAKVGTIRIGSHCDIGAGTMIISQGANVIEDMVSIGAGGKIGGGLIQLKKDGASGPGDPNDFSVRGHVRVSKGSVRIGTKSVLGENVTVLDGATIGAECVVGAAAVIRGQIPDNSVVALQERLVVLPRAAFSEAGGALEPPPETKTEGRSAHPKSINQRNGVAEARVVTVVLQVIAELNQMLPEGSQLHEDTSSPLVRPHGPLDSLGVINLLVAVEDAMEVEFGERPNLTEMGVISGSSSHLATVGSLAKLVAKGLRR